MERVRRILARWCAIGAMVGLMFGMVWADGAAAQSANVARATNGGGCKVIHCPDGGRCTERPQDAEVKRLICSGAAHNGLIRLTILVVDLELGMAELIRAKNLRAEAWMRQVHAAFAESQGPAVTVRFEYGPAGSSVRVAEVDTSWTGSVEVTY